VRTFFYEAYDRSGVRRTGWMEAEDARAARLQLAREGFLAESLQEAGAMATRRRALGDEARGILYRELAALLHAGTPLVAALQALMGMAEFARGRAALAAARDRLREGAGLAEALAESGVGLDSFERAALEAGARAGRLEESLENLADWLLSRHALRARIIHALTYPAVILLFALGAATLMLGAVLPATLRAIERSGVPVQWPRITRVMLALREAGLWMLPTLVLLGAGVAVGWRLAGARRRRMVVTMDRIRFRMPLLGRGATLLTAIRFASTFGMALRGGVAAEEAILLAGRACGSPWVADRTEEEGERIRHGESLPEAVGRIPPLAGPLASWVETGANSGRLPEMMEHAARRLQGQWERYLLRLLGLLEPALLVLVGLFVFAVALAIILPLVQMNRAVLGS